MTENRAWKLVLPFRVPAGDVEGVLTEAILESVIEHAPADAEGSIVASADVDDGSVRVVLTLPDASREEAEDVARGLVAHVSEDVLGTDGACIVSAA